MTRESTPAAIVSRRTLLGGAARVGIGLAAAGSMNILPVHAEATARPRRAQANDRIRLGLIGCGGMGPANMYNLMGKPEVEVIALCDVDASHLPQHVANVARKYGRPPATFGDFRRLLDMREVDAVIIGTPDHWHALPLIMACQAGKDAYCEKPISHDITEARVMASAVKRYNRIVQVGTWQRSTHEFASAVAYIRAGKLGKITTVRAWRTDDQRMGHHTSQPVPAGLDYEFWVGPAAWREYIPEYTHNNWRWFLNFGTGMTGDWGVHMMDIGFLAMSPGTDLVMPTEVSAFGGKLAWPDDDRTAPDTVLGVMKFDNPNFVMQWETGRRGVDGPDHATQFNSADGKSLTVWRGGWTIRDRDDHELPKDEAPPMTDHWQNWLDCLKSREQPRSNLASMAQTTITCHLVNAAYLCGETVRWDKSKMDVVGSAGRNTQSYMRPYRKPWSLPKV